MSQANENYKMKYSLATNLDVKLLDEIAKLDKDKSIKVVFGKLKTDIIGGGRSSGMILDKSMEDIKNYAKACHDIGVEFNYLLNPMCTANKELTQEGHKEVVDFLQVLVDSGVDWVTINSPYLCKIIKKQFPSLKISVGIHACVSEIQHIRYWEELGADEITLQMFVTRNFKLLEDMLKYTKNSKVGLRVLGNNCCLHACPYRINHATGQSHASRKSEGVSKFYMDSNLTTCTMGKIQNPANLIASEWIRPEDVKYYEELCEKTGNYNLSIKLVERTKTTEFLVRVVKAYLSRSYEGNLLDILLWPVMDEFAKVKKDKENAAESEVAATLDSPANHFFNFFKLPEIYIDNKKLDGFMKKFVRDFECNKKACSGIGNLLNPNLYQEDETVCSYCKAWAEKAVQIKNPEETQEWLALAEKFMSDLYDGTILP
ncbi:U32 family peptidase [Anaeromicropila populeti]|uniref:Peptidase family U32 n=1 Tax=Anaeromicropila populeti TaxID=37658 RepID=A0A1I6HP30_9FIRM|nr:U32 family peptidase [Anaeromicropila populeti]SFR56117.1 Peptidase family U32 [Anaeromicropila populeti]